MTIEKVFGWSFESRQASRLPSPLALPLMVERFREKLSTEKQKDRLDRMLKEMEREAQRV